MTDENEGCKECAHQGTPVDDCSHLPPAPAPGTPAGTL